ncbi:MAG: hypothetical protein IPM79_24805 [Polyangiaceae bacterium]|nr:hypothetical protein [Polyangiaceae bacterium]MBK8940747.1 hypothetical protein [Polyangiaceae bacterium]
MLPPFDSVTATRVHHNPAALAGGALPFAMIPVLATLAITLGNPSILVGLLHLTIFGTLGTSYVLSRHPWRRLKGGRVTIADGVLSVDGARVTSRDELSQGLIVPRKDEIWVRLDRKGRQLAHHFRVQDVEEGRAMLRALGFDATQATAEVRCMSPVVTLPIWKQLLLTLAPVLATIFGTMALGVAAFGPQGAAMTLPAVGLVMAYLFLIILAPTKVRIGADGLALSWLWRRQFIRFADVTSVAPWMRTSGGKTYEGIQVEDTHGHKTFIAGGQHGWNEHVAKQLEERVLEAWEAHRGGVTGADVSALDRGGRDLSSWVDHLRGLGEGAKVDLRRAFVPVDHLLHVLEDTSQPALTRAGAAIAAARGAGPEARARIRVAASTTASPKLRVAIERSLDDEAETAAIAEALGEVEAEQGVARR